MTTTPLQLGAPLPQGAAIDDLTGKQPSFPAGQLRKGAPLPPNSDVTTLKDMEPTSPDENARKVGYYVNDVGNKVIIPMENESFSETMKRAAQHGQLLVDHEGNLTAEGEREKNAEMATVPSKLPAVAGGVVAAGLGGPALLAAPLELHAALAKGIAALTPALAMGIKGLGEWAEAHPVAAKSVYEGLKWTLRGAGLGAGAKAIRGIIDSAD